MDAKKIADAIEADPYIQQARQDIAAEKKKVIKLVAEIQSFAKQCEWEPVPKMADPNPTKEDIGKRIITVSSWKIDQYHYGDLFALAVGTRDLTLSVLSRKLDLRAKYDWENRTWLQRFKAWWSK